jgi:hypothetical protein
VQQIRHLMHALRAAESLGFQHHVAGMSQLRSFAPSLVKVVAHTDGDAGEHDEREEVGFDPGDCSAEEGACTTPSLFPHQLAGEPATQKSPYDGVICTF